MQRICPLLLLVVLFPACTVPPRKLPPREQSWNTSRNAHLELSHCLAQQTRSKGWTPLAGAMAALTALTGQLDPHSYFLTPEAYKRFYEDHLGAFGGIGIHMAAFPDGTTVYSVTPNSPASRAGIKTGDRLLAVDGMAVAESSFTHLSSQVRGQSGTSVTLELQRHDSPSPLHLTLVREEMAQNSLSGVCTLPRDSSLLYLQLQTFSSRSPQEIRNALDTHSPRGAILDLRGNSGGSLQAALGICSLFLPQRSEVVRIQTRHGEETLVCSTSPAYPDLPLAVLTDENSASASEIVAAALQAHQRAAIVGKRTWGKALVQTVWPVHNHCGLGLTTGHYLSPGGRELQRPYPIMDEYLYFLPDNYGMDRSGPGGVLPDLPVANEPLPPWAATIRRDGLLFKALLPTIHTSRATCPQGRALLRLLSGHLPLKPTRADTALLDALARHEWHGMQGQTEPATQALLEQDRVADRAAGFLVESREETPHPRKETRP